MNSNVLCRLCLMKCEELFGMYITSSSGVLRSLPKIIRECISLEVTDLEPHFFSKFVCNECIYKLELFYAFRQQSLKSQEYYNGLLQYYQQSVPCTSKLPTIDPTAGPVHVQGPVESVFVIAPEQQIQPNQSVHSNNELADINFSGNEFMMDETEKNQLSKDYDDIIRSLQKDDLDFTTNDEELVALSEAHVQEIIEDVYDVTPDKVQSTDALPPPPRIVHSQTGELPHQTDGSYFPMTNYDEPEPTSSSSRNTACAIDSTQPANDKTCDVCYKTFRTRQKLTIHRNTHLRLAPFKCTFDGCSKAFKSRIGLEEHVARHTNSFEYTCDICSKGFQHRSYLSAHRRAHNTERNFQCSLCGQTFKAKQALLEHKNSHLGVKPFGCDQCDKQYAKNSLLQAHIRQQHEQRGDDAVTRYPCSECGKQFTSKSYLNVHMRIHRNDRPFVCETFSQATPLQVHRKLHDAKDHKKQLPTVVENPNQAAVTQDHTR
uniref:Protein krueppel n=1 Tax=Anopheles dirus TaxID=7168 RepID=A0A182NCX0_9DIPT